MPEKKLIVIAGPTGVGKTAAAIVCAKQLHTDIISADSRQFFKEIPIGTAAPTAEERAMVSHHFVGNLSVSDYYNVYKYEVDVLQLLETLFKTHNEVILCGGSGMYIDAVCKGIDDIPDIDPEIRERVTRQFHEEGIESLRTQLQKLDPEYYAIVDLKNHTRLMRALEVCVQTGKSYSEARTNTCKKRPFAIQKIALNMPREELYDRINRRVEAMIAQGLEEEARAVYHLRHLTPLKTVGYREFFDYFDGNTTREFAIEKIKQNSRNYAKRQITWLKRDGEYEWHAPSGELIVES
ncbi:MAG: tRNA (adenosine(37)-N6)-dimethylallyltransferase MiaA [Bacteroidales bacterium]|jgi:tRNA dimethylallyltransferase|nr:tRNA (adenosine(37)-N6)-dimethylallyltransferase MiaA [Bacteroidales bacterium]